MCVWCTCTMYHVAWAIFHASTCSCQVILHCRFSVQLKLVSVLALPLVSQATPFTEWKGCEECDLWDYLIPRSSLVPVSKTKTRKGLGMRQCGCYKLVDPVKGYGRMINILTLIIPSLPLAALHSDSRQPTLIMDLNIQPIRTLRSTSRQEMKSRCAKWLVVSIRLPGSCHSWSKRSTDRSFP